ncbi:transcriptional activator RinB [Staphylococcus saprophyticus]
MRILKTLLIIAVYELSKYVTNEIIIKLQANDDIEQPKDYHEDSWKYQY